VDAVRPLFLAARAGEDRIAADVGALDPMLVPSWAAADVTGIVADVALTLGVATIAGEAIKESVDASSKPPVQVRTQIVEPRIIQVPAGSSVLTP
jgi:hypothetical protein